MSDIYTQTDTDAPLGVIQACAPVAPAADADAKEAVVGGTAGVTAEACGVASQTKEVCYADELRIGDDDSLDAGTLTYRLNVSTAQNDLTLEDIYVCRVNSSGVSQETLGSVTGLGTDISGGGVFPQNITLSAASAHNAGDRVYILVAVNNANQHTARSIEILPDQNIDTPFVASSPQITGEITDGGEFGETFDVLLHKLGAISEGTALGMDFDTSTRTKWEALGTEFGDTFTAALLIAGAISEGAEFGETLAVVMSRLGALNEGAEFGESLSVDRSRSGATSEGAEFGETLTGIRSIADATSDGAEFGETLAGVRARAGAATEGSDFGEAFDAAMSRLGTLTEGGSFGDTFVGELAGVITGALDEGATFGESFALVMSRLGSITEGAAMGMDFDTSVRTKWEALGATFGDTFTGTLAGVITGAISEGADFGETLTATRSRSGSVSEGGEFGLSFGTAVSTDWEDLATAFGDSFVGTLAAVITGAITEGASFGETLTGARARAGAVTDGGSFGETLAVALTRLGTFSEGAAFGDTQAGARARAASVTDDAVLGGSFSALATLLGSASEGATFGASFTALVGEISVPAENIVPARARQTTAEAITRLTTANARPRKTTAEAN